jgi:hypothetical protein
MSDFEARSATNSSKWGWPSLSASLTSKAMVDYAEFAADRRRQAEAGERFRKRVQPSSCAASAQRQPIRVATVPIGPSINGRTTMKDWTTMQVSSITEAMATRSPSGTF